MVVFDLSKLCVGRDSPKNVIGGTPTKDTVFWGDWVELGLQYSVFGDIPRMDRLAAPWGFFLDSPLSLPSGNALRRVSGELWWNGFSNHVRGRVFSDGNVKLTLKGFSLYGGRQFRVDVHPTTLQGDKSFKVRGYHEVERYTGKFVIGGDIMTGLGDAVLRMYQRIRS